MSLNEYGDYRFYIRRGNNLYDIENYNKKVNLAEADSMKHYVTFGASPSNERQGVDYMIDVTDGPDHANNILSVVTYGSYKLDFGKMVPYATIVKSATRWYQYMAPSFSMGMCEAIAVYFGKFNGDLIDGAGQHNVDVLSDNIFELKKVRVVPEALEGKYSQDRPGTCKQATKGKRNEDINRTVEFLDSEHDPIRFETVTPEIQADIEDNKCDGRVVIFGKGRVTFLVDLNGLKAKYDFSREVEATFLAFAKSNESNFSTTIFQKMLLKDRDRTMKLVESMVKDDVIGGINRRIINPKAMVVEPDKLTADSIFMDDIIASIFPRYIKMDANLSMKLLENEIKRFNKLINRMKIPMMGKNSAITVGEEIYYQYESFLGDHEVFCPDAEKMFKKLGTPEEDWILVGFKYPTMEADEYLRAHVVSTSKMKERIRTMAKPEHISMLINDYCKTKSGTMIVPACELFKKMIAGSDFDFDKICWTIHPEIVDILKHEPLAINIVD
jgi:hypothetical protein